MQTPAVIGNRPGLTQIAYRAGTWSQFKSSMLDALSKYAQLAGLRTRDDDDFTIALCDAFAVVCDILTFYYERSANEHYLRTATEQLSVTELAALIGYQPAPGVAASAALAFILEAQPPVVPQKTPAPQPALVPSVVTLASGLQVQSVPGPGQQPVTFETVAPITARYDWNALTPQQSVPYAADPANCYPAYLRLTGLLGTIQVGDYMLIVVTAGGTVSTGLNRVAGVTPDSTSQTTLVRFETTASTIAAPLLATAPHAATAPLSGTLTAASLGPQVLDVEWADQGAFVAQAQKLQWDVDLLQDVIDGLTSSAAAPPIQVVRLGVRASIFGHNAPAYATLPSYTLLSKQSFPADWENETVAQLSEDLSPSPLLKFERADVHAGAGGAGPSIEKTAVATPLAASANNVFLDATYAALVAGTWVVLLQTGTPFLSATVTSAATTSVARFLLSATVSVLTLAGSPDLSSYLMRTTAVFGQTDVFTPAQEFLSGTTIGGSVITLDSAQLWLQVGQDVIVSGTSATKTGQTSTEQNTIYALGLVNGCTQITLASALQDTYVWNTVTINANVAPATHGASKSQILGSGDGTQAFQRFALNQLPVTYVSANTPTTTASTLAVRVNGALWTEVPYFSGSLPTDRVFVTNLDTNGNRYVQFGDGVQGARLPTGQNNVVATYRQGLGSAGNVAPNQLSTLLTRPLGLRSVLNPLAANGGGDSQTLADARSSAPITVRALGRIVSLDDFADFTSATAAVAKASAVWAWDGARQVVCITVAGPGGVALVPGSQAYKNLLAAIMAAGDGTVPVMLASYTPRTFTVGATLTIDPALDPDAVTAAAKQALQAAFAFGVRAFMQPVYQSEIVAVLQAVTGVVSLTIDSFAFSDGSGVEYDGSAQQALVAGPPVIVAGALTGAELLTIDGGPLPNVVHA